MITDPPCAPRVWDRGHDLRLGLISTTIALHSIILSLPRNPIARHRGRLTATLIGVSVRGYVAINCSAAT
jgi:hypothetical protein